MYRFVSGFVFSLCVIGICVPFELAHGGERERISVLLKTQLHFAGCHSNQITAAWDAASVQAMKDFNKITEMKLPTYKPTRRALEAVQKQRGRVCPLICDKGKDQYGDRCFSGQQVFTGKVSDAYDGVFQVSGERVKNYKKLWCTGSFDMKFEIQGGRTTHKIPLGHLLKGEVRDNKLYFSSARPDKNGGHWIGIFAVGKIKDEVTMGTFKWAGASNGATCAYQVIIKKL